MSFKSLLATISIVAFLTSCTETQELQRQRDIDDTIAHNVADKIRTDRTLSPYDINVKIAGGNVELSGVVDTHAEAAKAADTALTVSGVRSVRNDLKVRNLVTEPTSIRSSITRDSKDTSLTAAVKLALINNRTINSANINVSTRNSIVYLTGTTPTHAEASQAGNVALKVKGVKQVDNQIAVE